MASSALDLLLPELNRQGADSLWLVDENIPAGNWPIRPAWQWSATVLT